MNEAHKESLELLSIVHKICVDDNIKYTLAGPSIIEYENNMDFDYCEPIVYIAVIYSDYVRLCEKLQQYSETNSDYSFHDYYNTIQMNAFEAWFVKEAKLPLIEQKKSVAFYYGTRLIITPVFCVGNTEKEWEIAYKLFRNTIHAMNRRAVLKGQTIENYIRYTPKRVLSNYYIRRRNKYAYEKCIEQYGNMPNSKYVVYPFMLTADKNSNNSLVGIVNADFKKMSYDNWTDIEEISLWDVSCFAVKNRGLMMSCFPQYYIKQTLNKKKSQLLLNGGSYLWRVQQVQLELLKEFDRICRKYDIKYNINFGTLMGAARHKGFIPWDDDIDVSLLYTDFNRLDEIMEKELDKEKYYFRCPANEKNNHLIFKHLERKGTTFTKPGRDKLENQMGVFIDVFPMYPSAPLRILDIFHDKICKYWRTALWATVGADSEKDEKKRLKYQKMAKPGNEKCYENFVKAATFFHNDKYLKYWPSMKRNAYKVPLVRVSNYTDTTDIEFEGYKFMAPRDYEPVLEYSFGKDWRMYPTVRGRLPSHNAIMEIGDLYEKESRGEI